MAGAQWLVNFSMPGSDKSHTIMSLTMSEVDFVENMTQEQLRYENICQRQNEALSLNVPEFEAAVLEFQTSSPPLFAKPGQCWEPAPENVDDFLKRCDEICDSVPQNAYELSLS